MSTPLCLAVMTFPQRWDGRQTLTLNVVLIPAGDPVNGPLIAGTSSPSFAAGTPSFSVFLGVEPDPGAAGVITLTPSVLSAPASPAATFALLQSAVTSNVPKGGQPTVLGSAPVILVPRIRKALPASYLALGGGPPDGNFTTTEDEFGCALRGTGAQAAPSPPPARTVSWGQVISYALRQPVLANRLGLIYQLSVTLSAAQAQALAKGSYVGVTLAPTDPWATAAATLPPPNAILSYAAHLPPLGATPRAVFAAIGFPIAGDGLPPTAPGSPGTGVADLYADGFAKLVHCAQPANADAAVGDGLLAPGSDLGIQLGWDDQQVVQWHNDQLSLQAAGSTGTLTTAPVFPLGVSGYRVDVADITPTTPGGAFQTPTWQSLCQISTTLPSGLGSYIGELCIEPVPTQSQVAGGADAWLPRYFANWRGGSLCEPDPVPQALTTRTTPVVPTRSAVNLSTLLSYGHTYAFRVRLGDLSCGGPQLTDAPADPGPASTGTQTFQRLVPPKAPQVQQLDGSGTIIVPPGIVPTAPASLLIRRPLIVYPEVLYTHLGDLASSRDAIRTALVNSAMASTGSSSALAGLPDPDVAAVSIEVRVRHPQHDTGTEDSVFLPLYTVQKSLTPLAGPAPLQTDPGTPVTLVYVDAPSIVNWSPTGQTPNATAPEGPLLIPRGRDVQIVVRGVLRSDEPAYFGASASQAMAATILVRVEPVAEGLLLGVADANEPVTGYLFRRPLGVAAPTVVAQLASQLGVVADGSSLTSPPGQRVVFGASAALRTQISADGETLTFGAPGELLRHWLVAIVLDLERDWTWDGLAQTGFTVLRGVPADSESTATAVGSLKVPRVLGPGATLQPSALARSRTRLMFFDAIDPHEPVVGGFPQALSHRWFVQPAVTPAGPALAASPPTPVLDAPPLVLGTIDFADAPLDLTLPIAIPPDQVPAVASLGLALSPYQAGPLYASTTQRQRSLWIELTASVQNPAGRALFARVLANGPDPILYDAPPFPLPDINPPLTLDPELVRVIIPGQTDDRAGLTAMTPLTGAPDALHFLLPLPPGVAADDPRLFGFWSYELRIGHAGTPPDQTWWSTANARFGSPLRLVGVQHPAPALACHPGRINIPASSAAAVLSAMTAINSPFPVIQVLAELAPATPPGSGTPSLIVATASYATPVFNGSPLVKPTDPPKTAIWFLLYAQAVQTDGASMRNILIAAEFGVFVNPSLGAIDPALVPFFAATLADAAHAPNRTAVAAFHQAQVEAMLAAVNLPASSALSVIAVELLPGGTGTEVGNPAGLAAAGRTLAEASAAAAPPPPTAFPFGRILRVSPLTPVAPFC